MFYCKTVFLNSSIPKTFVSAQSAIEIKLAKANDVCKQYFVQHFDYRLTSDDTKSP